MFGDEEGINSCMTGKFHKYLMNIRWFNLLSGLDNSDGCDVSCSLKRTCLEITWAWQFFVTFLGRLSDPFNG